MELVGEVDGHAVRTAGERVLHELFVRNTPGPYTEAFLVPVPDIFRREQCGFRAKLIAADLFQTVEQRVIRAKEMFEG